jgi:glycosyltransferase involved in cell wall biosynthesis
MRLTQLYVRDFGPPDVLHAQSALWGGVSAMKLASRFGVPYVVTEHSTAYARGMIKRWQEPLVRETFRRAGAVLAVSRGLSNLLAKYVSGAKVQVVPNMVDTDFFVLPPRPRDAEAFTFLTVALLQPKKGIDVLVQAFAQAFGHRPDVCLEIGGDGPQRDELESLAANLGVSGAVRFLGVLSPADVREAMWRANVFVLSSYVETFGVVLIEAMATGLPVIATRCGGPEHLIRDSLGCLVDPGSADQLARALASVYERYPKWRGRDKETRQHIVSNYSNNAVANALLEVFRAVAGRS